MDNGYCIIIHFKHVTRTLILKCNCCNFINLICFFRMLNIICSWFNEMFRFLAFLSFDIEGAL